MTTNINLKAHAAVLLLVTLLTPTLVSAQYRGNSTRDAEERNIDRANMMCERLEQTRTNALAKLTERAEKLEDRGDSRNNNVDTRKEERLAKLDSRRGEKDDSIQDRYESLRGKATTDEQKAAVEEFISTVKDLQEERRSAVDAAIAVFESAVEDLKAQMQSTTGSLKTSVEADLNNIFDDAEAACDSGASLEEVRTTIATGMEAMRNSRQSYRQNYSFRDELEALRATRQAAFKAAGEDFKTGLEAAKADLRAAFEA